ncbi:MAG: cytochrome c maturation protein CcmE [Lautropia sp.]|nr:cytochrome c maturation protein CcmE [Lautropia sp.]
MTPRQKRFVWIGSGLATLAAVAGLLLYALNSNIVFFFTPTQVAHHEAPSGRPFRIGGLVEPGSLQRQDTRVQFIVTDGDHQIRVAYVGTLPDLFREGKGVVAQGRLDDAGNFSATEVLAKHDENYMPPEAASALQKAGHPLSVNTLKNS